MLSPTLFQMIPSVMEIAFTGFISLAVVIFIWSLWEATYKGWMYARGLHQIPCSRCSFFTGEYNLKCTIHPYKALNEAAIDCPDYLPVVISSV